MDDAFGARPFDGSLLSLSLSLLALFRSLLRDFFVRMPFSVIVARAMGKYGPIGMDRYVVVAYYCEVLKKEGSHIIDCQIADQV